MKGYWIIFGGDILDHGAQSEYGRLWAPIGQKYGAKIRFLEQEALVEASATNRVIIVEFDSLQKAKECYFDPSYTEAKESAIKASRREIVIIEGKFA